MRPSEPEPGRPSRRDRRPGTVGPTGWLLCGDRVLAALDQAPRRGWQRTLDGAVLLRAPTVLVTGSAPDGLDVARCREVTDDHGVSLAVRRVTTVPARRAVPVPPAPGAVLIVGRAGAFERWGLTAGDVLHVGGGGV